MIYKSVCQIPLKHSLLETSLILSSLIYFLKFHLQKLIFNVINTVMESRIYSKITSRLAFSNLSMKF